VVVVALVLLVQAQEDLVEVELVDMALEQVAQLILVVVAVVHGLIPQQLGAEVLV
jgi:hypothetical protein